MATVNFSVPDDVKESFNATFAGANKSAIIAELMQEAVAREKRKRESRAASTRIRARRADALVRSSDEIRASREQGRS